MYRPDLHLLTHPFPTRRSSYLPHRARGLAARELPGGGPVIVVDSSEARVGGAVRALSGALGVGSLAGGSLLEGVVAHIGAKELVVVLDDASANDAFPEVVSTLVERCPALPVVVTSPLPLRLDRQCLVTGKSVSVRLDHGE